MQAFCMSTSCLFCGSDSVVSDSFPDSVVSESFAIPWTAAHQLLCPWDSPSKNTGVGCHFLLQEIFLTRGSNPCLLYWQVGSLPLVPPEKRHLISLAVAVCDTREAPGTQHSTPNIRD